jgi:hypothetical protein
MEDIAISQEFHQVHLVGKDSERLELLKMQPDVWILHSVSAVECSEEHRVHHGH